MTIVLASRNVGKVREIRTILSLPFIEIVTVDAVAPELVLTETGTTFEENAIEKALIVAEATQHFSIADDSGLEVDALDGAPGVFSSRYAGPDATDEENIERLLSALGEAEDPKRTARFRCAAVFASPDGDILVANGVCDGRIIREPRGNGGFGYDPVFVPEGEERTFAELPLHLKNSMSHRARAFTVLRREILEYVF